ncbi:hypothetical protein LAh8_28 [Aeromonas phage LAh_8]|uniref:Uncharacterized protein n=2 Tax=Lahexavirus TaxID=2843411 RepID=A0A514A011_9CAUD|nr:hypothetical protein HWC30_gp134 [Aeromonas phage LAh_6]YP_009847366.1 hypothetical protein HWC31_gp028 [Aeromonas phage LAh_8]QDH46614.1 hypothetical protein LAh6_134 [Aeromonas phage LAh_6]QDH46847.1 hypothetical protein LAh8_28 [Aeromonas phage LAh_8]
MILSNMKMERRKFLFWFNKRVVKGHMLLTEKEAAWAGWVASMESHGIPTGLRSILKS